MYARCVWPRKHRPIRNPMNATNNITAELTPQNRLALSRRAIVRHMHQDDQNVDSTDSSGRLISKPQPSRYSGTWGNFRHAVRAWWEHHPVSAVFDLVKPLVGQYARDKPFKLLGIAAGAGVAIAIFKPWRVISVGGVLLAAMKSSDVSGIIFSMLSPASNESSETNKTL